MYEPMLTVFVLTLLAIGMNLLVQEDTYYSHLLGKNQNNLISKYQEGEKLLFNVDESARLAMYDSIYELSNDKEWPIDFEKEFLDLFKKNLKKYLKEDINYDIKIEKGYVVGKAGKPIELDIKGEDLKSGESINGKYIIYPHFKEELDLSKLKGARKKYETEFKKEEWLYKEMDITNEEYFFFKEWKVKGDGEYWYFEIDTGEKILYNLNAEDFIIKFKVKRG